MSSVITAFFAENNFSLCESDFLDLQKVEKEIFENNIIQKEPVCEIILTCNVQYWTSSGKDLYEKNEKKRKKCNIFNKIHGIFSLHTL